MVALQGAAVPRSLLVGGQQVDCALHVFGTGARVQPRRLERGVAHQLGYGDDVDALAGQFGAEGVAQQVAGDRVVQARRPR
jgi:hypothetical protein